MPTVDLSGSVGWDPQVTHTSLHGLLSDGSLWFQRTRGPGATLQSAPGVIELCCDCMSVPAVSSRLLAARAPEHKASALLRCACKAEAMEMEPGPAGDDPREVMPRWADQAQSEVDRREVSGVATPASQAGWGLTTTETAKG